MKIVVLTGAGISAESGIKTFRDADGLWEGHDVMQVASPEGWEANPKLVLDFYNQRRRQLKEVAPNAAHEALAKLEQKHEVHVVTQNVDDLHERAGSSKVIHLHGELFKVRSVLNDQNVQEWRDDLHWGDTNARGEQLRPHIVWFGEAVPKMQEAIEQVTEAEALIIVGTSMQVYPAAGLMDFAPKGIPVYFIDPNPAVFEKPNLKVIAEKAARGVPQLVEKLLQQD